MTIAKKKKTTKRTTKPATKALEKTDSGDIPEPGQAVKFNPVIALRMVDHMENDDVQIRTDLIEGFKELGIVPLTVTASEKDHLKAKALFKVAVSSARDTCATIMIQRETEEYLRDRRKQRISNHAMDIRREYGIRGKGDTGSAEGLPRSIAVTAKSNLLDVFTSMIRLFMQKTETNGAVVLSELDNWLELGIGDEAVANIERQIGRDEITTGVNAGRKVKDGKLVPLTTAEKAERQAIENAA